MVSAGNWFSGPTAQSASSVIAMRNTWDVRSGRTPEYDIWQDELNDALARLGLDIGCLAEEPPLKPVKGSSLSLWEKEYDLWYDATVQFQREGTDLFDTVRHSMIVSGPYAQIDVRAISMMKKGAIKDGRALLRWAFEFVDSSSLSCQMELVKELNQKTIGINVNKCEFSDHMISLYEMWRQKEGANVDMPAEYFQRLLMSMPTAPEGPLVRVRSKIADLVEENSPILQNMDGEGGFFSRMAKYADSQGIKEGVEKRTYSREMGEMHAMHNQEIEELQCGECMSWVCKKTSDKCICKHNSTFDIGKMKEGQKKEYVEMVRAYSKLNPGASLLLPASDMRRALIKATSGSKPQGALAHMEAAFDAPEAVFMPSDKSVPDDGSDAIEKWLAENIGSDNEGLFVMGGTESGLQSPTTTGFDRPSPSLDPPEPRDSSIFRFRSPKKCFSDFLESKSMGGGAFSGGGKITSVGGALEMKVKRVQYLLNYLIDRPNYELIIAALSAYVFLKKMLPRISNLSKMMPRISTDFAAFKMGAAARQRIRAFFNKIMDTIILRLCLIK